MSVLLDEDSTLMLILRLDEKLGVTLKVKRAYDRFVRDNTFSAGIRLEEVFANLGEKQDFYSTLCGADHSL